MSHPAVGSLVPARTLFALCGVLALLLASTSVEGAPAATSPAKTAKPDPIAEKIKALDLERLATAARNDVEAYAKYLADDLVYVHSSGKLDTKEQLLEAIRSGKTKYVKFEGKDLSVRILGTTAIVNGEAHVAFQIGPEKVDELHIRFTDVWAKRAGKWQLVSWHSSKVTPPSSPPPAK